jgi:hypothetical protein
MEISCEPAAKLKPTHAGQPDIQNDATDAIMIAIVEVLLGRDKALCPESGRREEPFKRAAYPSVVVYDRYTCIFSRGFFPPAWSRISPWALIAFLDEERNRLGCAAAG